jgi:hypothetical protein
VSALTGAILAGSTSEQRLEKLGQFWAVATPHTHAMVSRNETLRQTYNGMHSVLTLLFCRPNIIQCSLDPALVTPLLQGCDRERLVQLR